MYLYISDNTMERMHKSTVQEAGENTIGRHEYLLLWIVRRVSDCDANQRGKKFTFFFFNLYLLYIHIAHTVHRRVKEESVKQKKKKN